MEENITSILADFWVTETKFYPKRDITQITLQIQDKRITTDLTALVGEDWWKHYAEVYKFFGDPRHVNI